MSSNIFKTGNTAVITGGASGIGLALAKKCVGHGMRVVVADRNAALLAAAREQLGDIVTAEMDVGRAEDWAALQGRVEGELGGRVHLLALNAAIGTRTTLDDGAVDAGVWRAVLETNVLGVVHGLAALLPLVKKTAAEAAAGGEGGPAAAVVITGSKQGITNPPGNPAYNASKAAVRSLAEQLSFDLAKSAPAVGVHMLVPGWTWTGIAGGVAGGLRDNEAGQGGRQKPDAAWWPEQVVDYLEARMRERQFWVLCPDNEVTEEVDRKRMLWSAGDAVEGRAPLSRWREEYKGEVEAWMKK